MEAKAKMIYLDTHVLVWLYAGKRELIPEKAINLLEQEELLISPICELELQYLFETRRISVDAKTLVDDLGSRISLTLCPLPFDKVISVCLKESWTRDPFDRMITSQARLRNSILVTKDQSIRKHYSRAKWD